MFVEFLAVYQLLTFLNLVKLKLSEIQLTFESVINLFKLSIVKVRKREPDGGTNFIENSDRRAIESVQFIHFLVKFEKEIIKYCKYNTYVYSK